MKQKVDKLNVTIFSQIPELVNDNPKINGKANYYYKKYPQHAKEKNEKKPEKLKY